MPTLTMIVVHARVTAARSYTYQFTPKHHGGDPQAAQWQPAMTLDEEFAVFDLADLHELADDRGWLYGVQPNGAGLRDLGTWSQQIAEFPFARAGQPWHGYPIWAVNGLAPQNRRGEKMRPEKEVFVKMQEAGLLTASQRKRLERGKHV